MDEERSRFVSQTIEENRLYEFGTTHILPNCQSSHILAYNRRATTQTPSPSAVTFCATSDLCCNCRVRCGTIYCSPVMLCCVVCCLSQELFSHNERSFLKYIRGGMDLNLMLAVDFSDVKNKQKFMDAMSAIASQLVGYDSDSKIPLVGFTGKSDLIKESLDSPTNFPLYDGKEARNVNQIQDAYESALRVMKPKGAPQLTPVIERAARMAARPFSQRSQFYQLLIIMLNGTEKIDDLNETIDTLVKHSPKPLSIMIVGIGEAFDKKKRGSFADLATLDIERPFLMYNGNPTERENFQFYNFSEYADKPQKLAEAILKSVTSQVLHYTSLHQITPLKPTGKLPPVIIPPKHSTTPHSARLRCLTALLSRCVPAFSAFVAECLNDSHAIDRRHSTSNWI